ncbi:GumC family protein [Thermocoleostomius sinensis]|uniref:Uncharacterized protein n=1 Tax=Thermocoleostomius sinensis A174 TaxID=2016057 RepID=A0A9E9C9A0_9CYAN|nr:hypothetical protein [Thermocoleostomius sinensis]WAL62389.1 hypothetical protein OXH18_10485 [Thermocoleostomius sinensis A174]
MKINQTKLLTVLLRHRRSVASSPTDSNLCPIFDVSLSDIPELVKLLDQADRILQSIEVDSLISDAQMAAAFSEIDIMLRLAEVEPTLSDLQLIQSLEAIDQMLWAMEAEAVALTASKRQQPDTGLIDTPQPLNEVKLESTPETEPEAKPEAEPETLVVASVPTSSSQLSLPSAHLVDVAQSCSDTSIVAVSQASVEDAVPINNQNPDQNPGNVQSTTRSFAIPRQVGIAAGVTIAVTAGTAGQVANRVPEYEGTFQLVVQTQAPQDGVAATPQIDDTNQRISETQIRILESPRLLDPIIEQLQAEHPDLDFQRFSENLDITVKGDRHLEVRYRDTDSQRVQLVLEQLAKTYVDYNNESCRDSACQGLKFIDAQIPQAQQRVSELRDQIQRFHQQHGLKNLEMQVRLFSARSAEIAKQEAELSGKLANARRDYEELQMRMALQPDESIAQAILDRDGQYQALLKQFRELDRQIVTALSSYQAEDEALRSLRAQHQTVAAQLGQEMVNTLERYVTNPASNLQDPVFQEPELLKLLQQSISTVHQINLMEMRQQTIAEAQKSVTQRKQELATVLRQYGDLRQQLQAETKILQQYFDQREELQAQVPPQQMTWQLVSAPELIKTPSGEPVRNYFYDLEKDLGSAAVFGALIGVAIAVVTKEKRSRSYTDLRVAQ